MEEDDLEVKMNIKQEAIVEDVMVEFEIKDDINENANKIKVNKKKKQKKKKKGINYDLSKFLIKSSI